MMIKSNTWHVRQLDPKLSWRFFKYKLVLDDLYNRLRRDCEFMKTAIGSARTEDGVLTQTEYRDSQASLSQCDISWALELSVHPPSPIQSPWTLQGMGKPIRPPTEADHPI